MPVTVPTSEEFNALSGRVESAESEVTTIKTRLTGVEDELAEVKSAVEDLENAPAPTPTPTPDPTPAPPVTVVAEYPGLVFQTNNTEAALRAAVQEVLRTRTNGVARKVIRAAPGTTVITNPDLLGSPTNGQSDPIFGFEIEGLGERVTTLAFNPTGGASTDPRKLNMFTLANRARDFKLRNLKVTTNNPNASMLWAWSVTKTDSNSIYPEYGSGQNQRFIFTNVEWGGHWKRVIGIDGDVNTNNNSEWSFDHCNTDTTARFGEAFLQSGGISGTFAQQTQYLNFFARNCNFTYNGGSFFRFIRGGNLHIWGGSWSAASNANALIWLDIQGAGSDSASNISVTGTRFEPKATNQKIIRHAVGSGIVTFKNVIDSSSLQYPAGSAQSQFKLHEYIGKNGRLPVVTYENCNLVGSHIYSGKNNGAQGKTIYRASKFYQWTNNNAVASAAGATDGFVQWTGGKPSLRIEDCEGQPDFNG